MIIIISETDEGKLLDILERNELEPYVFVIIRNSLDSTNSRFYYQYIKPNVLNNDFDDEAYNIQSDQSELRKEMTIELDNLFLDFKKKIEKRLSDTLAKNPRLLAKNEMFKMFYGGSTHREVSELLDIPATTVYNSEKRIRLEIEFLFANEIKTIKRKLAELKSL